MQKHRPTDFAKQRILIFLGPVLLVYGIWLFWMISQNGWHLFLSDWYMTLTMVFGSFIAGASSEGGGAIAYPVMTLIFEIDPSVARNFSLAIQSVGMTAASLWIIAQKVPIEKTYLWIVAAGGTGGIIFGTYLIAPYVLPAYAKMMFVSFWLSYGIALFFINHIRKRTSAEALPALTPGQKIELVAVGFVGGILSAILGNGIDICSFAFVTLKYRLSEKIATPTSVILMAMNAVVGTLLHGLILQDLQPEAINFWLVCIPVVVLGAPMGAYVISKVNRLYIAVLLYAILLVQFVSAILIIRPSGMLILFSAGIFLSGLVLFFWLTNYNRTNGQMPVASE
ncbi:TSUP family transporter [Halalkalibaculum sp. DA3122]|uniref:TSUP family transporter n=1 Tax=Halalkalibaculum sp. DA3122 TaxID=3373607 RepID=UPI0037548AAE